MGTYLGAAGLQRNMSAKANAIRRGIVKSSFQSAVFIKATAIKLAPRHSGETVMGINKKKIGPGRYRVTSKVAGNPLTGFKQNLWANRSKQANFPRAPFMRWAGKKVLYGVGVFDWTGTPRFFHFATLRGWDKFKSLSRQNTSEALAVVV